MITNLGVININGAAVVKNEISGTINNSGGIIWNFLNPGTIENLGKVYNPIGKACPDGSTPFYTIEDYIEDFTNPALDECPP